jgi:uncharacterized membrane protein YkvA (DUF1232 family)
MRPSVTRASRIGHIAALYRFFRDKEASLWGKAFVLLTVAYVLWPMDLVPDVAPVIGWLDDLGLATIAMVYLARVTSPYRLHSGA